MAELDSSDVLDNARLVPKKHDKWYRLHRFSDYNIAAFDGCNDIANGITLRSDIRRCLDNSRGLVFVPLGGTLVAHFLDVHPDYAQILHNVPVDLPARVPVELVYARFALNVLSLVHRAVRDGGLRTVPVLPELLSLRTAGRSTRSSRAGSDASSASRDAEHPDGTSHVAPSRGLSGT